MAELGASANPRWSRLCSVLHGQSGAGLAQLERSTDVQIYNAYQMTMQANLNDADRIDAEHIRLLSIFHYVLAALGALFACFPIFHIVVGGIMLSDPTFMTGGKGAPAPPASVGYLFIGMGLFFVLLGWTAAIATFVSGRFLSKRKNRTYSIVIAAMLCTCIPFGTILGVFTLIVLCRDSVRRIYESEITSRMNSSS